MTRNILYQHYQNLVNCQDLRGETFAFAVFKNIKKLERSFNQFQKTGRDKAGKELLEYMQSERKLEVEYHKKDKEGSPMFDKERKPVFEVGYEEAKKTLLKNSPAKIEEKLKQQNEWEAKFMQEEVKIDFHKVKIPENLPENINANEIRVLEFMLEEANKPDLKIVK